MRAERSVTRLRKELTIANQQLGSPSSLLSVVIPVYNEAETLPLLFARLEEICSRLTDLSMEVLFVDDHSKDNTPALLRDFCSSHKGAGYLRLSRNCGSHVAILAGLERCRGDVAVFLAADLQDPPEVIGDMVKNWRQGNHVVWAVREKREGTTWGERITSWLFYRILNLVSDVAVPPQGSDFALLDRIVIDALLLSVGTDPSLSGDIARLGFRQATVPYIKEARHAGKSHWTIEKKLRAFADAFVSFSYAPLRLMSYFGLACSVFGFGYAFVVLALHFAIARPVQGYASLMVVVLVLGGVQMAMLGVLGEYLWRTLEAARRRPRAFIEEMLGAADISGKE